VTPQDAELFRKRRTTLGLDPLVIHDNYLINLASPDLVLRANSIRTFHDELRRAVALGADYLVAHPGNSRGSDRAKAIEDIVQALRLAALRLELSPGCGGLRILLENTSGQGTAIGSRFEELKAVLDACPELPLGVCLDTAHMFEAGYDIRKPEGLEKTLEAIGRTIGFERVFVIHVNDSKTPLGSRVDRHEQIGRGHIGLEAFRRILNHPLLAGRAFILETPIDKPGDDRRNVRTLWKLVGGTPRQIAAKDGFPAAQRRHRRRLPAA
jgi:deoxyribonuclease-4